MNTTNRIPISVRITREDVDFIAELKIEGADTPSEKVRELFKLARLSHTRTHDYGSALVAQGQFFQATRHEILHAKKQVGVHSHVVARLFERLPDLGATLAANLPEEADLDDLKKYERGLMWRIVHLIDNILQLAVTGRSAAYDDTMLQQLENTLKLTEIVQQANEV